MNIEELNTTNIEFRKVYLSDLNAVLRIYKKEDKKLTAHFGLPLSVATENNEIIGFASASLNELNEMQLNAHCIKVSADSAIINRLKEQAKNVLHSTFENIENDRSQLKISIQQLVGWLNKCSV